MQLVNKKNLAVSFAASKEESRYMLSAILVTKTETVATDGHVLARVSTPNMKPEQFPVVTGFTANGFEKGLLAVKTAQDIEKAIPKKQHIPILEHAAVSQDGENLQVAVTDLETPRVFTIKPVSGQFPNWEAVWPHEDKPPAVDIHFDAGLLKRIADAAVKFGDSTAKPLRMRFYDRNSAARFDMVNSDGQELNVIAMPYRGEVKPQFKSSPAMAIDAGQALAEIHKLMDGQEWNANTFAGIVAALSKAGYPLTEPK